MLHASAMQTLTLFLFPSAHSCSLSQHYSDTPPFLQFCLASFHRRHRVDPSSSLACPPLKQTYMSAHIAPLTLLLQPKQTDSILNYAYVCERRWEHQSLTCRTRHLLPLNSNPASRWLGCHQCADAWLRSSCWQSAVQLPVTPHTHKHM
jgi:hypothetical protein